VIFQKIYRTISALIKKREMCNIILVHERSNSVIEDPYLKESQAQTQDYLPAYYNNPDREMSEGIDLDVLRYACLFLGFPIFILPALLKMVINGNKIVGPVLLQCGDVLYYFACRLLLRRIGAQTVALTVAYSHYPLIVAAKNEQVDVIEYQHGMISRHHIGYVGLPELLKPNRIECFDDIWKEQILELGFFATCSNPKAQIPVVCELPSKKSEIRVLVIGQTTLTESLNKKSMEFEGQYGKIRYRPHPNEAKDLVDVEICEHAGKPFIEVLLHYDLFIGVYSTALYEAWFSGKHVLILDHPMNKFFDILHGRHGVIHEATIA
jgi:hypothetical protein